MKHLALVSLLTAVAASAQVAARGTARQPDLTAAQIAKKVSPSVVVIKAKNDSGDVVGSGFIISKDGKIVTNLHVIMETKTATVQLANGEIYDSVSVLATDQRRDLAVLRIPGFNLPVLELGDSDSLTIGEPLVILGTPRGLEGTVTAGILSSVRDSGKGFRVLQTDAAVNSGNSGGPLLNSKGQAIGVVSFKLRSAENLNFAVPINYLRGLLTTLHDPIPLDQVRAQFAATSTPAQETSTPSQSEIMTEVPRAANMRSILKGMGFEFTEAASDEMVAFRFQLNGYKVTLFDFGSNIQLYLKFSDKIDPAKANEWNRQYRYSRAYVDTDGGAVIEADLDLEGGVTRATIEEFIKTFRTVLDPWGDFVSGSKTTANARPAPQPTYVKSSSATKRIPTPFGKFALWIDPDKWKATESDDAGVLTFEHVNGEGYARVITERIGIPTNALKDAALANMRKKDPNAKVTFEQTRIVNGKPVLALQLDATSQIPWRFYGYVHGGTSGSIQVMTYTSANAFDNNATLFTEFLNGLEIKDDELAPSSGASAPATDKVTSAHGVLLFNAANMSVTYDPNKWEQTTSTEAGHYTFKHKNGDGYGMVIAERISIPTDSLPDVALSNAREADPNARIVFRERRSVAGVDVWFLKIAAEVNKIPFVYYGYYYGGKAGTVQVLAYTGANLVPEYDKDFREFLNGLRVLQL